MRAPGTLLAIMLAVATARAGPLGYVYNAGRTDTLAVFDTDHDEVMKVIPLVARMTLPRPVGLLDLFNLGAVTVSPDGHRVFVLFSEKLPEAMRCSVFVVDTAGHRVTHEIDLPVEGDEPCFFPRALLVPSPNGSWLYTRTALNLHVINLDTATVTLRLRAPSLESLAVAPGRTRLYVIPSAEATAPGGRSISVIDTDAGAVVSTIPLPDGASLLESPYVVGSQNVVSGDGTKVLLPVETGFIVVDTAKETVTPRIDFGAHHDIERLVFSEDGARAYVVTGVQGGGGVIVEIMAFDTDSLALIGRLQLGFLPGGATFIDAPDRRTLFVNTDPWIIIDLAELRERARVDISTGTPSVESFSPDGHTLYLPLRNLFEGGELLQLDVTGVRGSIDLGSFSPLGVTVTEDARKAYVRVADPFGFGDVELVNFETKSVTAAPFGIAAIGIALGGQCERPLGCLCARGPDCDDADPCTTDTCPEGIGCRYTTLDCFPGALCRFQEGATDPCPQRAIRRLSARARRKISAAKAAAQQEDQAHARTLLRTARSDVRKALAVSVRFFVRKDSVCGSVLISDQIQRLRSLKAVTRDLPTCEGRPPG
jgi:DNA-binding beta-propeller fold protein YncE